MHPTQRFYPSTQDFRCPFSRDRDRIIHCSSFRRLEYKTQVFLNSIGDFFRTRLTHTLEVSQIARSLAKGLCLNESLCEAIALAHDLGHTPFGHSGGDELHSVLHESFNSQFDHNFQSFRIVNRLEKRYAHFDGLNLTFATLEGILKHSQPYKQKFFNQHIDEQFKLDFHPSLEAIIVDYSDAIAYISHDIDDGLKCGFLSMDSIRDNGLVKTAMEHVKNEGVDENHDVFQARLITALIHHAVTSLIHYSKHSQYLPKAEECVPLCASIPADKDHGIGFEHNIEKELRKLKEILYTELYCHDAVKRKMAFGKLCIRSLFNDFMNDKGLLPKAQQQKIHAGYKDYRVVSDFIANMSDRSAISMYQELHLG